MATKPDRDASPDLGSEEDIVAYLRRCAAADDPSTMVLALGNVARARNMSALARQVGMTREGLYKALSPAGNPSFTTISKVAAALGYPIVFQLDAPPLAAPAPARRRSTTTVDDAPRRAGRRST